MLDWITRTWVTGVHVRNTKRLSFAKKRDSKLWMFWPDTLFEVGNEAAFIASLVLDNISISISTEIVHHKLPPACPIPRTERHFWIDRLGVEHEACNGHLVRDEDEGPLRGFVIGIVHAAQARVATSAAGYIVAVRQDYLVTITVRGRACATVDDEIEPQLERINAHKEIAELPAEPVLPVLVGRVELSKPPVTRQRRSTGTPPGRTTHLVEFPTRFHRRDEFDERRGFFERVFAGVTNPHERPELALQHLRDELETVVRVDGTIEIDFLVADRREHACKSVHRGVGRDLLLRMQVRALAQERRLNGACGRPENVADDLGELFFGMADVHQLVEAQQRRGPTLFLQVVRYPLAAPTNAMFVLVAWCPNATSIRSPCPGLRGVWCHMLEAIQPMLNACR